MSDPNPNSNPDPSINPIFNPNHPHQNRFKPDPEAMAKHGVGTIYLYIQAVDGRRFRKIFQKSDPLTTSFNTSLN